MAGRLFIGASGWSYPHRRGRFHPERWPHARELAYASARFNSLEVKRSFYSRKAQTPDAEWLTGTGAPR